MFVVERCDNHDLHKAVVVGNPKMVFRILRTAKGLEAINTTCVDYHVPGIDPIALTPIFLACEAGKSLTAANLLLHKNRNGVFALNVLLRTKKVCQESHN